MKRLQLYISILLGLSCSIGWVIGNLIIGNWWFDNVLTGFAVVAFASHGAITIYKSLAE